MDNNDPAELGLFLSQASPTRRPELRRVVLRFHAWMAEYGIRPETLTYAGLWEFFGTLCVAKNSHYMRYAMRKIIHHYLYWLQARDHPAIPIRELCPRRRKQFSWATRLPEQTTPFLEVIRIRNKTSTYRGYRSHLLAFHCFLEQNGISLPEITRRDIENFLRFLVDAGLLPASRRPIVMIVRSYLIWLHENGALRHDPQKLLVREDFPKIPDQLPRPFPFAIDQEIQKRLAAAEDRFAWGLLLMRKTGLRVGELASLPYHCVHRDLHGNAFLKVPLGKLDSERMVPLDISALEIIARIRKSTEACLLRQDDAIDPERLIIKPSGSPAKRFDFIIRFNEITHDLPCLPPPTTHQLRHTYATTLLNAGMSLVAIKSLLGHRCIQMTLKYAAVAPETIRKEYFAALQKMEGRYQVLTRAFASSPSEPQTIRRALADLMILVKRTEIPGDPRSAARISSFVGRLNRLKHELLARS